ncbi:uncharacterized protein LOC111344162, partial [Stylophora pistillata]|uniref:uncharacterized protein LOC111344162 n=1 Tax=Stylophora pistillata TaxID=50429 RepID=UPI000C049498
MVDLYFERPIKRFWAVDFCQVSSRDFDTSLLVLLLRNIWGLTLPASGQDDLPLVTDTTPAADITRIKILRDRVYNSHVTSGSVDDPTFSFYWNDIQDTFQRIGGVHYQNAIDELKIDCMDADLEEGYQELLKEWLKDEECITDKSHEDEVAKKARKEGDLEDSIEISEQSARKEEIIIMPGENRSALNSNASPPKLSVTLPLMRDLPETSSAWINVELPVHILLLTVEDCEFLSCFAFLKEPFKSYHISIGYVYFGCIGDDQGKKMKIALMRCSKGPDVPGGSLSATKDAILLLRPKAIFSVGACSGLDTREVKLGDVVVSAKLITAAHKTPPSRDIGNLIKHVADGWKAPLQNADEYNAKVHCDGVFLSISEANKDMIGQHPEAIAVEMEGGGENHVPMNYLLKVLILDGMMADSTWCKLVIKSQTPLGGFQCVVLTASLTAILIAVQVYHPNDRLNFSCDPKPSDFIRNSCYNKEKSNLNIAVIAVGAIFILFGILEILYLWCTKGHVVQKILGDVEIVELGPLLRSLPEKPTITNVESEVDKDFTVTWSEVEANSSNCSIKYRLEWTKQPMTQSTELVQRGNIVETHYEITGLEYDAEVVVSKLTTLSLSNNITDTSAASLCEALQHPSGKLNTLDLADNEVTDTGVASLCEALQRPSCKLTTLNLRRNEITDTGVASLCRVLQHPSCKLTTLNLCHNEITDIGVASLCKALQHPSCKLTMLYLLGNEITDAGVPSLCEAFQHPS